MKKWALTSVFFLMEYRMKGLNLSLKRHSMIIWVVLHVRRKFQFWSWFQNVAATGMKEYTVQSRNLRRVDYNLRRQKLLHQGKQTSLQSEFIDRVQMMLAYLNNLWPPGPRPHVTPLYTRAPKFLNSSSLKCDVIDRQLLVQNKWNTLCVSCVQSPYFYGSLLCKKNWNFFIISGRFGICAFLKDLPKTSHDPASLTLDLPFATDRLMTFTVTGIFKERENGDDAVRHFNRFNIWTHRFWTFNKLWRFKEKCLEFQFQVEDTKLFDIDI